MTLEALGSIGEFVAALATVGTLVYLAAQIRQNTTTVRASTHHEGATAWSELLAQLASDPELCEIFHRGRVEPDGLSSTETRRFVTLVDSMLSLIENFHFQYRNGQLGESNQERFDKILIAHFATPGFRRYWPRRRDLFTREFVSYIEEELALTTRDEK